MTSWILAEKEKLPSVWQQFFFGWYPLGIHNIIQYNLIGTGSNVIHQSYPSHHIRYFQFFRYTLLKRYFLPFNCGITYSKAQKRPKRALSLLSLYTLLANVFCFHFSAWSWGFFLLNRILWILRLFFLFFNNSFCRFMDFSLETDALSMDEDAQSQFLWFFLRFLLIVCLAQSSWLLSSRIQDTKKCLPGTFIDSKVPNRHCCLTISCS